MSIKLAWQQMGSGPDVILIHGLASSRAFWYSNLAQRLKSHYRITLFDLRGHGYSEAPREGYSSAAMAGDLLALMQQAGIHHAHLIGHSYGGSVAAEFAQQHPERCLSLAMMDSRLMQLQTTQYLHDVPHISEFERQAAEHTGRDWSSEPQIGFSFLEALARLRAGGWSPEAIDGFTPFGEGHSGIRAARQFTRLLDETTAASDFLTPGATPEALAAMQLPTLLLYGGLSRCLQTGHALAQLWPHAEYRELEDARHFFPITHAEQVGRALTQWLTQGIARQRVRLPGEPATRAA